MKNFNISRFNSLLKYDLAENGKAYAQAIAIAFLVYFVITAFVYYIFSPIESESAQAYVDGSGFAAIVVSIVFFFLATSHLIVNRYCEARTATIYNMLPATNLEKGCLVIVQLILLAFVVPVIFYVISYTLTFLAMVALGFGDYLNFHPYLDVWSVYDHIWNINYYDPDNVSARRMAEDRAVAWMGTTAYTLIPVSLAISTTTYHIFVTFFRNKRVQIKALFTYFIFNNIISWILTICGFTIAALAEKGYMDRFEELARNHPGYIFGTLDVLLLCQIPVLAALLWWFFKRLHYKEIR